ncbi:FAD/NAD(P)-binding domain-containing protein [Hypoxylon sp. FL0890]|nr:FAD/NAD(P)-binding domain-containing protein [Hypoxylon sp. FL0890]
MAEAPIRIAIVGGGFAGATLANALLGASHLEVHIFESAPEFSERGAAVGLSGNARLALQHILPAARETLAKAGAVPINSTRIMLGSGPDAGSMVGDFDAEQTPDDKELIVHRASLLRELLAPLPKEHLHPNKKLTGITETTDGVELAFQDGTTSRFDAIIGADGIFGSVRKYVLQDAAEKHAASPGGWWDSRIVVPIAKAKALLGEQYFDVPRQYLWAGDGIFVLHDVLENGSMVQGVISGVETDPPANRKRPLTHELLAEAFQAWPEGSIAKGIIDLLLDQPEPQGYSQYEHKSTPTYANGRVCIMGDAAHATTPWQGAGAGQAFEDAVIIGTLLANISTADEIDAAFKAYDAVRRPRCQRVIDSSRGTGEIFTGQNKEVAMTVDGLRNALSERWDFLYIDLDAHKEEALSKMREIRGGLPLKE